MKKNSILLMAVVLCASGASMAATGLENSSAIRAATNTTEAVSIYNSLPAIEQTEGIHNSILLKFKKAKEYQAGLDFYTAEGVDNPYWEVKFNYLLGNTTTANSLAIVELDSSPELSALGIATYRKVAAEYSMNSESATNIEKANYITTALMLPSPGNYGGSGLYPLIKEFQIYGQFATNHTIQEVYNHLEFDGKPNITSRKHASAWGSMVTSKVVQ